MDQFQYKQLWRDPDNWKGGLVYNCPNDPRILVPKKTIGWTINFGRPSGWTALFVTMIISAGIVLVPFYPCFKGEEISDITVFIKPFILALVVLISVNVVITNYVVKKQGGR